MRRGCAGIVVLVGCSGPTNVLVTEVPAGCQETWTTVGDPVLRTWCTTCHHADLPVEGRAGAPVGADFDTFAATMAQAEAVRRVVESQTMPPTQGMPDADRQALLAFLDCGVGSTGSGPTEGRGCDTAEIWDGDLATASPTFSCEVPLEITGDLTVDRGGDFDCVCGVSGDLLVAAEANLAEVTQVDGDLVVSGAAVSVALPRLQTVLGSVSIVDNPTLAHVELWRLTEVGGDLRIEDDAVLTDLSTLSGLLAIGGDLVVARLDGLTTLAGFPRVATVGGEIHVVGNPQLTTLEPMGFLTSTAGIVITDQPRLNSLGTADALTTLGRLEIRDNDALASLGGWIEVDRVDGDLVLDDNDVLADLGGLAALEQVRNDLVVTNHPELPTPGLEAWVAGIDVGGTVQIAGNGP